MVGVVDCAKLGYQCSRAAKELDELGKGSSNFIELLPTQMSFGQNFMPREGVARKQGGHTDLTAAKGCRSVKLKECVRARLKKNKKNIAVMTRF